MVLEGNDMRFDVTCRTEHDWYAMTLNSFILTDHHANRTAATRAAEAVLEDWKSNGLPEGFKSHIGPPPQRGFGGSRLKPNLTP